VTVETASKELLREVKRYGTSDEQFGADMENDVRFGALAARPVRCDAGVQACRYLCGRIRSFTPYLYSTYEDEDESDAQARPSHDSGQRTEPHRAGIEFDYCCCMARTRCAKRFRNHHGELQSGDGIDGLRHFDAFYFEP